MGFRDRVLGKLGGGGGGGPRPRKTDLASLALPRYPSFSFEVIESCQIAKR